MYVLPNYTPRAFWPKKDQFHICLMNKILCSWRWGVWPPEPSTSGCWQSSISTAWALSFAFSSPRSAMSHKRWRVSTSLAIISIVLIVNPFSIGKCISLKECYPYFKIPEFNTLDTWVMGLYDTCSYQSPQGRQVSGNLDQTWQTYRFLPLFVPKSKANEQLLGCCNKCPHHRPSEPVRADLQTFPTSFSNQHRPVLAGAECCLFVIGDPGYRPLSANYQILSPLSTCANKHQLWHRNWSNIEETIDEKHS